MCGHASRSRPLPPQGQPGGLLIRRDGFQSHGVPLIKTDKHLLVAGRWWVEAQSWGCPHLGWKH